MIRIRKDPIVSLALAVGGGWLWGLCHGRETSWWLPWVAFVPLMLLVERPRRFWWGWLYGTVVWLVSVSWIAATLETFGGLPEPLSWALLGLMALLMGFDQALFTLAGGWIRRAGTVASLVALPALWVVIELARGFFAGGFPWNLYAYAIVDVPGALALSAWTGAWGVSYLAVFANVALFLAWRRRRWQLAALALLVPAALLSFAGRFQPRAEPGLGARAAAVQPDTPIVASAEEGWRNYQTLLEMSVEACRSESRPLLLVWPESAAWPLSYERSPGLRRDVERLGELGCQVLLGSATGSGGELYNSALLVRGGETVGTYAKRRLVPWGEYVPFAEVFPFIGTLARNAGQFTPGRELGLMPWGEERVGLAICYEVIFPGAVAEQVRAGATVLATITNDAWYGDTAAPWQHFRAARFRAAENRRPLLRAALTGVSGLIDRSGAVRAQLGVGERGVLKGEIAGSNELALFARAPWAVPFLCVLTAALAIVQGLRARRPGRMKP